MRAKPRNLGRAALVAAAAVVAACATASGAFASSLVSALPGELAIGRYTPMVATLKNGEVLIAAGDNPICKACSLSTAELLNPRTKKYRILESVLVEPRGEAATVTLRSGKVLIVGGWDNATSQPLANAELFDPATESFSRVKSALLVPRDAPAAVLMRNGEVLITGGLGPKQKEEKSAEVFDPATGKFRAVGGTMKEGRYAPAAGRLPNGNIVLLGGYNYKAPKPEQRFLDTVEEYVVSSHTFRKLKVTTPFKYDEAGSVTLQNGKVLSAGGYGSVVRTTAAILLFNPRSMKVERAAAKLKVARDGPGAAILPDGRVVVVSGALEGGGDSTTSEVISFPPGPALTYGAQARAERGSHGHRFRVTLAGGASTEVLGHAYFQYGTSASNGRATRGIRLRAGFTRVRVSAALGRLAPGSVIHYRLVVVNSGGKRVGRERTFRVPH